MAKYQQYEEYKDIQNEWVSSVPSDWKVVPLKALCLNPVKDGPHETPIFIDEGIPFLSVDGIQNNQLVFEGCRYISAQDHEKYSRKCAPAKGDVLLGKAASVGKVAYVETEIDFNVWSPLAVITPKTDKLGKYIFYAFQSTMLQAQCDVYSNANTQKNLGMNTIDNLHLPFPSYKEAETIANFLDYETAQIDTLIEKQQTLIQLLKEKRQAVISHAVTKGLNPDAPMKDSGVEWLGEVPEHWVVLRLKHLISSLDSGCSVNAADIPAQENEIGVLKTSCVYTRAFRVEENKTVFKEDLSRVKCPIRKGAIIISRMNTPDLVGASAIIGVDADNIFLPDRLWQTNFNNDFDLVPDFLAYFMTIKGFRNQISLAAEGASSSMQSISKEDYLSINCILPPIKEQQEIIKHIEEMQSKFNDLVENAEQAIQLMQERRTALISAAVTGKIDVRGWRVSDANYESH